MKNYSIGKSQKGFTFPKDHKENILILLYKNILKIL